MLRVLLISGRSALASGLMGTASCLLPLGCWLLPLVPWLLPLALSLLPVACSLVPEVHGGVGAPRPPIFRAPLEGLCVATQQALLALPFSQELAHGREAIKNR
jgi:hypothetical protein